MNTENNHPLHRKIGEYLEKQFNNSNNNITLLLDDACGGKQKISLFLADDKTRGSRLCQVDAMILKNNEIKIIIEIEETDLAPINILGKLFAPTIAKYYIHDKEERAITMADDVCFIQVVDTKKLSENSKKFEQFENIENAISEIKEATKGIKNAIENNELLKNFFSIKSYKIIPGKLEDKEKLLKEISDCINKKLKE